MTDINILMLNSIRADLQQINSVSQNIANANTPGFKEIISNKISFDGYLNFGKMEQLTTAQNQRSIAMNQLIKNNVKLQQGQLKKTGNPLDVSINGEGFMLASRNGIEHLISSQSFSINKNNQLETNKGSLLLGNTGPITVPGRDILINEAGEIYAKDRFIDQIFVVDIADPSDVSITKDGLLVHSSAEKENLESSSQIMQGYLQVSNVDSSRQMIKLMEVTKHIESTQKAFSTMDQIFDVGINQIGKR